MMLLDRGISINSTELEEDVNSLGMNCGHVSQNPALQSGLYVYYVEV
jgi:hypothetical protein